MADRRNRGRRGRSRDPEVQPQEESENAEGAAWGGGQDVHPHQQQHRMHTPPIGVQQSASATGLSPPAQHVTSRQSSPSRQDERASTSRQEQQNLAMQSQPTARPTSTRVGVRTRSMSSREGTRRRMHEVQIDFTPGQWATSSVAHPALAPPISLSSMAPERVWQQATAQEQAERARRNAPLDFASMIREREQHLREIFDQPGARRESSRVLRSSSAERASAQQAESLGARPRPIHGESSRVLRGSSAERTSAQQEESLGARPRPIHGESSRSQSVVAYQAQRNVDIPMPPLHAPQDQQNVAIPPPPPQQAQQGAASGSRRSRNVLKRLSPFRKKK
ncbi:hypothetical protein CDAR_176021 [Caerostris darwini]|uniref:Uncharacterized protein n=1 Tax=Caerostris darwini TaxID=1538125 RepID=A0AAV4WQW6_9ARAC|nr:hypothetical protein CDAR_176021 [Caerostris darwini]